MTTRKLTQNERVLIALRRGLAISQLDFDGGRPTIDAGPPIRRLASRITDLRREGYPIRTVGRRNCMTVYALDTALQRPYDNATAPTPAAMFDVPQPLPPAPAPPRSPYEVDR